MTEPAERMAGTLQPTAGTPGEVGQTVWSFREASIAQRAFDDGVARQQAMQATQAILANSPSMTAWDGRSGALSVTQSHPFYNSFQHSAAISVQDAVGAIAILEIRAAKVASGSGTIAGVVRRTGRSSVEAAATLRGIDSEVNLETARLSFSGVLPVIG